VDFAKQEERTANRKLSAEKYKENYDSAVAGPSSVSEADEEVGRGLPLDLDLNENGESPPKHRRRIDDDSQPIEQ